MRHALKMEERMRTSLVRQTMAALMVALGLVLFAPTGASAVGVGKTCGGIRGTPCDAGLFCEMKAGTCNIADNQGKCVKVPRFCPDIFKPVCGCDGKTYSNDCARRAKKAQKNHNGRCRY